ncbi:hypothetical protein F5887DRAFT_938841 [Amanita rubescens]|nr:hypothetical protein F5887DRAFT_938841 [Amanita rubescens]
MFEPLGNSSLFTFTMNTVEWWRNRDMVPAQWRQDNNAFITLSKISLRQAQSVTTNTSQPHADAFRDAIRGRDTQCIISEAQFFDMVIASRLIPKRLGDVATRSVQLDSLANRYRLGFWHSGPDQYVAHSFHEATLNIYGFPSTPNDPNLPLHGHLITLPTNNPPIGVFNWNYLQCCSHTIRYP